MLILPGLHPAPRNISRPLTTSEPISSSTFLPPLPLGCSPPSDRRKQTQHGCQTANPAAAAQTPGLCRVRLDEQSRVFDVFEGEKKRKTVFRQEVEEEESLSVQLMAVRLTGPSQI